MTNIEIKENSNIDLSSLDKEIVFNITNKDTYLYLFNFSSDNNLHFEVNDDVILHLSIFTENSVDNAKITANARLNSQIISYFADFSVSRNHLDVSINLNKRGATCEWHLASLSGNSDDKNIAVSVYHLHPETFARIDNYGVVKDHAKLVFSGISHITKGCHQSKSHQNAKIVVFDEGSVAKAKPILKIDENDIEASHAATVGKVSDEHIFYLTSRGLSLEEAKLLITFGYLKPILKGFNEDAQKQIDDLIERRLSNV